MKKIVENIFQSKIDNPFGNSVQTAAYFLKRGEGNLIFYSSKFIEDDFDFISENGGVVNQIVNHRDEATAYCDLVLEKFDAPLICHEKEKSAILEKCNVGQTITEGSLFADIEAIHTPGHCPGSTCFLWKDQEHNILFTGDTFYPSNGVWSVAINDGDQGEMISSLKRLLDLEVTHIVPSLFIGPESIVKVKDSEHYRSLINDCIARLIDGKTH